jgi:hypothetical protein
MGSSAGRDIRQTFDHPKVRAGLGAMLLSLLVSSAFTGISLRGIAR